ncbi:MAG: MBL fold metallo-hydrolase [candidate division KSB1 bacterium]|nr:MBL fold metallo-hydrolase [candidate division KSB1 bacterium]
MMKADLHVFNIGHGAASLLQVQQDNNKTYNILIDGGPNSDLKTYLKARIGENTPLDLVILTHIHTDLLPTVNKFTKANGIILYHLKWST